MLTSGISLRKKGDLVWIKTCSHSVIIANLPLLIEPFVDKLNKTLYISTTALTTEYDNDYGALTPVDYQPM